jgi:hypothetical protein
MEIVDEVGDEILSDNVATIHPGIYGGRGNYETKRPQNQGTSTERGNQDKLR